MSDDLEPTRFVVFGRRGTRTCAGNAKTMLEARTKGAKRLGLQYEDVWCVVTRDGETDAEAVERERKCLR